MLPSARRRRPPTCAPRLRPALSRGSTEERIDAAIAASLADAPGGAAGAGASFGPSAAGVLDGECLVRVSALRLNVTHSWRQCAFLMPTPGDLLIFRSRADMRAWLERGGRVQQKEDEAAAKKAKAAERKEALGKASKEEKKALQQQFKEEDKEAAEEE